MICVQHLSDKSHLNNKPMDRKHSYEIPSLEDDKSSITLSIIPLF